ncbi:MAG: protein kinase [Thermodesulfobacteriota bacterium]
MTTTNNAPSRSGRAKKPLLDSGMILNGKWAIVRHMATGGKGEVYLASQHNLERLVVVKTISMDYLREFGDDEEEVRTEIERFHREAMAMAQVRHPYVVQVYDQDTAEVVVNGETFTVHYVVMEYVPGRTLRKTIPYDGLKDSEIKLRTWLKQYFLPILEGLETVHALGIVHRDIKPENVLLDGNIPKLTDFGIAGAAFWPNLTKSHHVEGTIAYMAPEQFMDLGLTDVRGDVYALGKILYEAVQGTMIDSKKACPLKGVCLPNPTTPFMKALDLIIQKATAEDRDRRTPSVLVLREQLQKVLDEADAADRPLLRSLRRKQVYLILGVILAIVAGSNLYHHFLMLHDSSVATQVPTVKHEEKMEPKTAEAEHDLATEPATLAPWISGRDGSRMRLLPGGEVKLPEHLGSDKLVALGVSPFYMDEAEVTNFQFVEFLNQVLSKIEVKDNMVRSDGQTWFVLGPVFTGFEPIVYRSGRFMLNNPALAAYPVVKVTGYGAAAYARYYGKRLPSEAEWLFAATRKGDAIEGRNDSTSQNRGSFDYVHREVDLGFPALGRVEFAMHGDGHHTIAPSPSSPPLRREKTPTPRDPGKLAPSVESPKPVAPSAESPTPVAPDTEFPGMESPGTAARVPHAISRYKPNADGIRGLEENVSEWGVRPTADQSSRSSFVILGGFAGSILHTAGFMPGVAQDPSMAFEDVGFRCVQSTVAKKR